MNEQEQSGVARRMAKVAEIDQIRGHAFLPPAGEMIAVPKLYGTENVLTKDKLFVLHFFVGGMDWWIAEVDPDTWTAFGFANLNDPQNAEWGYIDLLELGELAVPGGVKHVGPNSLQVVPPVIVERDLHWVPASAAAVLGERFGR